MLDRRSLLAFSLLLTACSGGGGPSDAAVDAVVDVPIVLVDECAAATSPCDAHATCADTPTSFTCTCVAGFHGSGTTCTDDDECALGTSDCDPAAVCTNTEGAFSCACPAYHEGDGQTCTLLPVAVDRFHSGAFVGGYSVNPSQRMGQSFTVGTSGQLAGIEVDIYRERPADARVNAVLEVRNPSGVVVARHVIADAAVPNPHQSLSMTTPGPTYIDLTEDAIEVAVGEVWSFLLSEEGDDTCSANGNTVCAIIPTSCNVDADCGGQYLVALAASAYAGGTVLCPDTCAGGTSPTEDVYFKTVVRAP